MIKIECICGCSTYLRYDGTHLGYDSSDNCYKGTCEDCHREFKLTVVAYDHENKEK